MGPGLGWLGIIRLGLVQTALGAVVVLTTSTMNRVMVVEYALPAMLPGALVAMHYFIQMSRPRFGYGSDMGGRRTPWIINGMIVLALGGVGASVATALMGVDRALGTTLAFVSFVLIGVGVGASGTSLLAFLAKRVNADRRAAAATIVWVMMIAGFAVTAGIAGYFLDPFSPSRLIVVTSAVSVFAVLLTVLALHGLEAQLDARVTGVEQPMPEPATRPPFREALAEVLREPDARRFTVFVFVSMLAYSAQDLILEPFAGMVFSMTPGESTRLSGIQHGGVLLGMVVVALMGTLVKREYKNQVLRAWTISGCIASALALACIAFSGFHADTWPLRTTVFLLGVANGAFAVAAIGSMMALAGHGRRQREGLRMGLWGAAQAIAFGLGGFLGTLAFDVARYLLSEPAIAYAMVFGAEAVLFLVAALLGAAVRLPRVESRQALATPTYGDAQLAQLVQGR